ncbi:hypothetical protein GWI33_011960 [Rhynchophorus ferrugineus]|uniref:Uncharacterized protein n=1 Tax=Rhynchophorus ferrugineus TaxID=354439 RepID=A0A834IRK6_RHYFE|nr:hypothetical protein GWI33_011960 [Rhynchophorus ferrugineus]
MAARTKRPSVPTKGPPSHCRSGTGTISASRDVYGKRVPSLQESSVLSRGPKGRPGRIPNIRECSRSYAIVYASRADRPINHHGHCINYQSRKVSQQWSSVGRVSSVFGRRNGGVRGGRSDVAPISRASPRPPTLAFILLTFAEFRMGVR